MVFTPLFSKLSEIIKINATEFSFRAPSSACKPKPTLFFFFPAPRPPADEEFDELCFEFGLELDDVVSPGFVT